MYSYDSVIDFCHSTWGEDRLLSLPGTFCVVDGATPIRAIAKEGYHTEAEWMADRFIGFLAERAKAGALAPLMQNCRSFLDSILAEGHLSDIAELDQPCLTLAAVLIEDGMLSGFLLGDCELHILYKDGRTEALTDRRTRIFSDRTCRAIALAKEKGEPIEEASAKQRYHNRMHMNQPDGYYVLSACGRFEDGVTSLSCPLSEISAVLICTDGFARIFSRENAPSPMDFLTRRLTLSQGLSILREHEAGEHFTNEVKRHDDAAAICVFLDEDRAGAVVL